MLLGAAHPPKDVSVTNTPSVNVTNTPTVSVAGTLTVRGADEPARDPYDALVPVERQLRESRHLLGRSGGKGTRGGAVW